ncbi:MAG: class II aldolase/adducin family protein [Bacteroidota bacterium]
MPSESQLRQDIVEVGRRIWLRGYVAANDGNISVRLGPDEFLTTPAGVSKGFMTPEMIVKVNGRGERISGELKPSSELKMHLGVYRDRPDVNAVVHAHPPVSTAFAVAGLPLSKCVLPEVIITLGTIPLAEYGTPSTDAITRAIAKHLKDHNAFLLENHGALTLGTDVFNAYYRMETVEHFAAISLAARQLGGERELPPERVDQLMEVRDKLGLSGVHPGGRGCGACDTADGNSHAGRRGFSEIELRDLVSRVLAQVLKEMG